MKTISVLLIIGALSFVPTPISALGEGCQTDAGAIAVGDFYVTADQYVYQEFNADAGLQRGGDNSELAAAVGFTGDNFGACQSPDAIVF